MVLAVLLAPSAAAAQGSVEGDREALEALYHATDGPNWRSSDDWLTDAPLGWWNGVESEDGHETGTGRVIGLALISNNLSGRMPAELGQLTALRKRLTLDANDLSGPIPRELGQLVDLEQLRLDKNSLTGPIPAELGRMASLHTLYLEDNDLSGPIPAELGQLGIRVLGLIGNALSGPIPVELGKLPITSLSIDNDTGLCLPLDFPRDSEFWKLAKDYRVPDCATVPALPGPAIFALIGALLTAGLVHQRRRIVSRQVEYSSAGRSAG